MYLTDDAFLRQEVREQLSVPSRPKKISELAEKRYMSAEVSSYTGSWDNTYAPFTVEIMNNLMPDSGISEVAWMKAGQIAGTVGVLENWMGYIIDENPGPTLYLTASDEVAKTSNELYLERLIESAGIGHKIFARSVKERGKRSGYTANRIEFPAGFILIYGAQSPTNYLRYSVENVAIDEVSSLPFRLKGKDIDPIELARGRQKGFEKTRKTLYLGVPDYTGGRMHKIFLSGDQRYYYIPCRFCGFEQILVLRGTRKDGKKYGIYFEHEEGRLIIESIQYKCRNCLKLLSNADKQEFLNAGYWKASAVSKRPRMRSYQLSSLYAPEPAYSWETLVTDYLECWDVVNRRTKDVEKLRIFVNAVQGEPFEERREAPKFERIISHRRHTYSRNEIKNSLIIQETGSPILILTGGVDVHKTWLGIEIRGWTNQLRSYSIDYRKLAGDGRDWQSDAWLALQNILENETWQADDRKVYRIALTLIDASYETDTVYNFCFSYDQGVFAIQGRDTGVRGAIHAGFKEYTTKGFTAYNINVGRYKDRLTQNLRRIWKTDEPQPYGYINFPVDYHDDYFREFEAEHKIKKVYPSGKFNYIWKKTAEHISNHAFDSAVYNEAAIELLCNQINKNFFGEDIINWDRFWTFLEEEKLGYGELENESVLEGQNN